MDIETALREELTDRATALDVPDDPWPSFARREVRHRRNRRVRIGVTAAALAGVLGLQSGLVPMPGWAPGIAIASTDKALVNSPTRGSLAGDRQWLDAMRTQVKDVQDPGERRDLLEQHGVPGRVRAWWSPASLSLTDAVRTAARRALSTPVPAAPPSRVDDDGLAG